MKRTDPLPKCMFPLPNVKPTCNITYGGGVNVTRTHTYTHANTHTVVNEQMSTTRSPSESPRQSAIKQDRVCSTPTGAFLQEQAHRSVQLAYGKKKARLCLLQNRLVT